MSDLVRELRELAKVWTAAFHGRADILTEAADEIERLQAVVDAARKAAMELIKEAHAEIHGATIGYGLALGAQKSTAEEILRALDGEP